jgi:trafficking protein particle complex subunit 5
VGRRFLEVVSFRDRPGRRETGVVPMLQFVSSSVWSTLFGRPADALERSTDKANAYMIRDDEPLTNAFISLPKDVARFNPAAFMGGILRGVLDGAGFPCTVQAVTVAAEGGAPRDRTVFLVTFDESVAAREG